MRVNPNAVSAGLFVINSPRPGAPGAFQTILSAPETQSIDEGRRRAFDFSELGVLGAGVRPPADAGANPEAKDPDAPVALQTAAAVVAPSPAPAPSSISTSVSMSSKPVSHASKALVSDAQAGAATQRGRVIQPTPEPDASGGPENPGSALILGSAPDAAPATMATAAALLAASAQTASQTPAAVETPMIAAGGGRNGAAPLDAAPADPLDLALDRAAPVRPETAERSQATADASVIVSGHDGAIQVVAAAPDLASDARTRLRKLADEAASEFGVRLDTLSVNGAAVSHPILFDWRRA